MRSDCTEFGNAILQKALYQSNIEPADPIGKPILAKDGKNLAPAIDVAVHIGDRADFHDIMNCPPDETGFQSRHLHESPRINLHPPLKRRRHRLAVRHDNQNRISLRLQF